MIKDAQREKINVIIVSNPSRISRGSYSNSRQRRQIDIRCLPSLYLLFNRINTKNKKELQIPFTSIGDLWYNYFRHKKKLKLNKILGDFYNE